MKKRMIATMMMAVMTTSMLAACGGSEEAASTDAPAEDALQMALVMDGSINDGGWYADCYAGGVSASEDFGYELAYTENLDQADFVTAIREYAAEGYDLIVLSGNNFEDAVSQVNAEFPETHFAGVNFGLEAENVTAMGYNNKQGGFLGGAFAGLMSETGVVGFIGGTDMQPTLDGASGFEQGAQYVNPDAKAVSAMVGSWNDVAKGKELAISQATTVGADVIFAWAGSSNQGIYAGCEESGIHALAEPLDGLDSSAAVLGSVLMSNEALIYDVAGKVAAGGYVGTTNYADADLMSFGRFNDLVDAEVAAELEVILADLASGKIVVE